MQQYRDLCPLFSAHPIPILRRPLSSEDDERTGTRKPASLTLGYNSDRRIKQVASNRTTKQKEHERSSLGAMVWRRKHTKTLALAVRWCGEECDQGEGGRTGVVLVFGMEEGMRICHGKGIMRWDTSAVWDQSGGKVGKRTWEEPRGIVGASEERPWQRQMLM